MKALGRPSEGFYTASNLLPDLRVNVRRSGEGGGLRAAAGRFVFYISPCRPSQEMPFRIRLSRVDLDWYSRPQARCVENRMIRRTVEALVGSCWELYCEAVLRLLPVSHDDAQTLLKKTADLFGLPAPVPVRVRSRR